MVVVADANCSSRSSLGIYFVSLITQGCACVSIYRSYQDLLIFLSRCAMCSVLSNKTGRRYRSTRMFIQLNKSLIGNEIFTHRTYAACVMNF